MNFNRIVEVWRAAFVDDPVYGGSRDWANATRVASVPASVQSIRNKDLEWTIDRETTKTTRKMYIRPIDVESTDRILIDGEWWEVLGQPELWDHSPRLTHLKMFIQRVEN